MLFICKLTDWESLRRFRRIFFLLHFFIFCEKNSFKMAVKIRDLIDLDQLSFILASHVQINELKKFEVIWIRFWVFLPFIITSLWIWRTLHYELRTTNFALYTLYFGILFRPKFFCQAILSPNINVKNPPYDLLKSQVFIALCCNMHFGLCALWTLCTLDFGYFVQNFFAKLFWAQISM